MSRARKRADRIQEEIPIQQVLADYGYGIDSAYDGEQQFSCDLHGDGHDNKPSARVYPGSGSFYCFACDQTRDAIELVREKEGMEFWAAVRHLEKRYGLASMPWDDDDRDDRPRGPSAEDQVAQILRPDRTFEDDERRVRRFLDAVTSDRELPVRFLMGAWEAHDRICYMVEKEGLPERKGREGLLKLLSRVKEKQREILT
jgi:DNA primase